MASIFRVLFASFTVAFPHLASAQTGINIKAIEPYSNGIVNVINNVLVPILIAIAFIVFLWGIYKYFIYHGDAENEKAEGRKYAAWGLVGLVIIFSVWGLLNLTRSIFGLDQKATVPDYPMIGKQQSVTPAGVPSGNVRCNDGSYVADANLCP